MQFKAYNIPIRTGHKYVAVFTPKDALRLDLQPGDRIKLKNPKLKKVYPLTALVDISDDDSVKDGHLGLFSETFKTLQLKKNDKVDVSNLEKPETVEFIKAKLNGDRLDAKQIDAIIKDVVEDDLTDVELTYLVAGSHIHGLSDAETANLTKAIVKNGQTIKFTKGTIVDKHCIGGVPGNRTTMLIVPIIATTGLKMPKTSSRSITSPSGTADTMEILANVTVTADKLKKIAETEGGFVSWGGGVDIAAADDHIIRVRHPLSLDPEGMMLASIMAKKYAVGSKHVLIDIPVGPDVKVSEKMQAEHLKDRFETIGKLLKMEVKVIFTDGTQPIGQGVGPSLEAIDVFKVLNNAADAPQDLKEKALVMSGYLLEMGKKAKPKQGYKMAKEILESGKALAKFNRIVKAQGKSKYELREGKYHFNLLATSSGTVKSINNKLISKIARIAGAPIDKYAGLKVLKKIGDKVKKDEPLLTVYADSRARLSGVKENLVFPYKIS